MPDIVIAAGCVLVALRIAVGLVRAAVILWTASGLNLEPWEEA
jgi:hypothetical protein